MTRRSSVLLLLLLALYCADVTEAPTAAPPAAIETTKTTTTTTTTTTTKPTTTSTTTTTTKPTTTTTTTTPKPMSEITAEEMTSAWTTKSDPPDSQPHCYTIAKDILLGLSAALNVILIVVIVVGVLIHTNRMPCMKGKKDGNKQDKYYYTHNTPGMKTPETPTTYDAIEAPQPQQQQKTYDAIETSKPQVEVDIDYEPVEAPKDKHVSVDNGVVSDQYLSVTDEPTTYENVGVVSGVVSPERDNSSRKNKPKPKPKPRLAKEPSTDSYTEMYSYTAMTPPLGPNRDTSSLILDATVPPPPEDHSGKGKGKSMYYNQDAILKSKSKQHAEVPSSDTDEILYCNQSAFIRGK